MAVLQIHVIRATGGRNQLNDRIKYIMNPEKTACKGFHSFFGIKDTLTSGFTCACDEAYQQMMETKQHEKKTDKVLGYHYIQSFKPGEVTPEEAHQAEWKAEQEYRPTIRNEIRRDIDVVLKQAHSLNNFWELLRLRGYEIKFNEKRKYAAIRPPNGKRFIRMKSLGANNER